MTKQRGRKFGQATSKKPTSPRRRTWINSPARQQKYMLAKIGWMVLFYGKEQVARHLAGTDTHTSAVAE